MIQFITSNLYAIIVAVVFVVAAVMAILAFVKLPTAAQVESVKEWLKYAVTVAEKELGSGTGQLKLRMVYELFIEKFTWLAKWITFEVFSGYVDEALVWMKEQLSSNQAVAALVSGSSGESEETYTATSAIGFEMPTEYEDEGEEPIATTIEGEGVNI